MSETLLEYFAQGGPSRIDRERGVLFGVKILGVLSRNKREYPAETLREAAKLYENAKVNLDHPRGAATTPRSYQDRFGLVRNVALRENEGLFADFHFNPKHPLAEQLLWDAEHAPENVGFSHNVEAVVERLDDKTVVKEILAVRSVDLVADPATTSGLFESLDGDIDKPDRGDLRSKNSDRDVALLEAENARLRERLQLYESVLRKIGDENAAPRSREQGFPQRQEIDTAGFLRLITG